MELRGVGDRWLAGETVPGVEFGMKQRVAITSGSLMGKRGVVVMLADVAEEPVYFVELPPRGVVRMRQSQLRAADGDGA